ncbi:hypothetical protein [Ferrovibrio sp.]|uniref:hypothetical protein n=1 Tax=Ferrovibrio sp. TaxID=1917215 RepID=UPI003D2E16BF
MASFVFAPACRNIVFAIRQDIPDTEVKAVLLAEQGSETLQIWSGYLAPGLHEAAHFRKLQEGHFVWLVHTHGNQPPQRLEQGYFSGLANTGPLGLRITADGLENMQPPRWTLQSLLHGYSLGFASAALIGLRCHIQDE